MIHYLLAMPREAEMFEKYSKGIPKGQIDIIGIGATNLDASKYSEEDILVNIGYAGGYKIPIGHLIEPAYAMYIKTWQALPIDRVFYIERRMCLTSDEFVKEPMSETPHLYDMELYKIATIPHKRVHAIKIISDNLDERDCEEFNSEDAWERAMSFVRTRLKGGK